MLSPSPLRGQQAKRTKETVPPVETSITVVGDISARTPANVSVIGRRELQETPGVNLDDRLRQVPGFSLFRRSSSLVAHPTTQGVTLRGLGASGASRSLVLWDGIPVNDPFGGWVYWTQFSPDELERVEISRGASTSIFGDRAMAGAIALFSRTPSRHHLTAGYEPGNENTHDVWTGYSDVSSHWAVSGHGRAFTTEGYYIVPEDRRGSVDRRSNVRFVTGDARVDYFGSQNQLFLKTNILGEERANGTVLQNNSTGLGTLGLHYEHESSNDAFSVLGFHTREEFRSSFSAIASDRNSERLTVRQTVPAQASGGGAFWQHHQHGWNILAGGDLYRAQGYSHDALAFGGERVGGGTQWQHGLFVQSDLTAGPARFFLGGRHSFTGQGHTFFSPSGGVVLGRRRWRARASVYRSFRAPTLNELYREFRVGNAVTEANAALRPETVFGSEVGADFVGESTNVRLTFYRDSLRDLITNVTLSSTPNLITRQRRNATSALSSGIELEADRRWRNWTGQASYLYVESRFSTGLWVPQVPRHQGSAGVTYQRGRTLVSAGVRSYASEFEDDLNKFVLPGFATVQLVGRQEVVRNLSVYLAFENLLDRQYLVGFSPTPTIGAPRLWRAGLHWEGQLW